MFTLRQAKRRCFDQLSMLHVAYKEMQELTVQYFWDNPRTLKLVMVKASTTRIRKFLLILLVMIR